MSAKCEICGKAPGFGNNISHSHRRTRRRWDPNVQKLRVVVNGTPKRVTVCTKCLKANKIARVG
ncbi:MAG: 50S ribosomal protein L28 [Actinobacteria bacterium]|nr:50S ribosomal protein L28 [Actinomycetota bacterium]